MLGLASISMALAVISPTGDANFQPVMPADKGAMHSSKASVSELSWLAGHWQGKGIAGAAATEVYSAPAGNQIVGHFRQLRSNGEVLFYELITIVQVGESLEYRIKHFNPDLTGWEEKDGMMTFRLSSVHEGVWNFNGLTLKRVGPDRMIILVTIGKEGGASQELRFDFERIPA